MRRIIVLTAISLFLLSSSAEAVITITASGGWTTQVVSATNLIAGAGSDLNSTYQSTAGITTINIAGCKNKSDTWRVDVSRVNATWDASLSVYVRRTSDGTGTGSITGGLTYIQVTTANTAFFNGAGDRTTVGVQYQVTGVSLNVPPSNNSTSVVFTIVDT